MGACYCAAPGVPQPRARFADGPPERVLHMAISTAMEPQAGQEGSLRLLGPYRRVSWWRTMEARGREGMLEEVLLAAYQHQPTLVWMQVQTSNVLDLAFLRALRGCCDPSAIIVLWTGDTVDYQAAAEGKPVSIAHHAQRWMLDISSGLDLFTASTPIYAEEVAAAGGCSAGFMQCGYDRSQFERRMDGGDVPCVGQACMTAHRYPPTLEEEDRGELARVVGAALPTRLHVWGAGWTPIPGVVLHDQLGFVETSYLYSHAAVTISSSCTHRLRRYTSGRLQRILGSAGCCAVRRFPDMEALGLQDGVSCLAWETPRELVALLADWLRPQRDADREQMRQAAYALARRDMTWIAAYEEMIWMVRRERERRAVA